jgi:hypothetical protein
MRLDTYHTQGTFKVHTALRWTLSERFRQKPFCSCLQAVVRDHNAAYPDVRQRYPSESSRSPEQHCQTVAEAKVKDNRELKGCN